MKKYQIIMEPLHKPGVFSWDDPSPLEPMADGRIILVIDAENRDDATRIANEQNPSYRAMSWTTIYQGEPECP